MPCRRHLRKRGLPPGRAGLHAMCSAFPQKMPARGDMETNQQAPLGQELDSERVHLRACSVVGLEVWLDQIFVCVLEVKVRQQGLDTALQQPRTMYKAASEAHRSIIENELHVLCALHVRRHAAYSLVVIAGLDPRLRDHRSARHNCGYFSVGHAGRERISTPAHAPRTPAHATNSSRSKSRSLGSRLTCRASQRRHAAAAAADLLFCSSPSLVLSLLLYTTNEHCSQATRQPRDDIYLSNHESCHLKAKKQATQLCKHALALWNTCIVPRSSGLSTIS